MLTEKECQFFTNELEHEVGFKEKSLAFLFGKNDWPAFLTRFLMNTTVSQLRELSKHFPEPIDIQPRYLPIFRSKCGISLILNIFYYNDYKRLAEAGVQSPHRHQFEFATRVLSGGYTQWILEKERASGEFQFGKQIRCEVGDGYYLSRSQYHHVFTPEPNTVTLMLRSPAVAAGIKLERRVPTFEEISQRRTLALRILKTLNSLDYCSPKNTDA